MPKALYQQILSAYDLEQFVSGYITLKKAGRNYKGLCPFHSEKTPSFTVSPDKHIWHCFGCGAGGNLFSFLMRIENLTFPQAAKQLSEKAGIPWKEGNYNEKEVAFKSRLTSMNFTAVRYYQNVLKNSPEAATAREYLLLQRGIKQETISTYQLGFSSGVRDGLCRCLLKLGYTYDEQEKAGLLLSNTSGPCDRFRNRVMFPIWDETGNVVGFAGRAIGEQQSPKYLNTPETLLFNKRKLLYGLHLSKETIRQKSFALLVEGYTDVISCYQHGIHNAVASMGTSLTVEQARLLRRFSDTLVLAYDPDTAGQKAMLRSLDTLQERFSEPLPVSPIKKFDSGVLDLATEGALKVQVVRFPQEKDPDAFLKEKGKEAFEQILLQSKSLLDFHLEVLLSNPSETPEQKQETAAKVCDFLNHIHNRVLQEHYIKKASENLALDESLLRSHPLLQGNKPHTKKFQDKSWVKDPGTFEKEFLQSVLQNLDAWHMGKQQLSPEDFSFPSYRRIFEETMKQDKEPENIASIMERLNQQEGEVLTELLLSEPLVLDTASIHGYIQKIKERAWQRKITDLRKELELAEREGNVLRCQELIRLAQEFELKRRKTLANAL